MKENEILTLEGKKMDKTKLVRIRLEEEVIKEKNKKFRMICDYLELPSFFFFLQLHQYVYGSSDCSDMGLLLMWLEWGKQVDCTPQNLIEYTEHLRKNFNAKEQMTVINFIKLLVL